MRFVLSRKVRCDLEDIAEWIALDDPDRVVVALQQLRASFRRIAESPLHYQLRPDIGEDARLAVVGRYVVLFWIDGDVVRARNPAIGGESGKKR